jgi:hypothetical protein
VLSQEGNYFFKLISSGFDMSLNTDLYEELWAAFVTDE